MTCPYADLGVSPDATQDEIKKAWKRLGKRFRFGMRIKS